MDKIIGRLLASTQLHLVCSSIGIFSNHCLLSKLQEHHFAIHKVVDMSLR